MNANHKWTLRPGWLRRQRRVSLSRAEARLGFYLVLPALAIIGLIILYPMLDTLLLSFFRRDLLKPEEGRVFVGLKNYLWLTESEEFWNALKNSVVLTTGSVVVQMILGMMIALLLHQDFPLRWLWRGAFIFPWAVPNFVTAFVWIWILETDYGAVNQLLRAIGLAPIAWLGTVKTAMPATIVVYIWRGLPWVVLVLLAGLQMIPKDLLDAAKVDGASPWQEFVHVILPFMHYVITITVILRSIWTINHFELTYLLTGGGPLRTTETLPLRIYNEAFLAFKFGKSATIGATMFILLIVFSFVYLRALSREGEL